MPLFLPPTPSTPQLFASSLSAHTAHKRGSAHVVIVTHTKSGSDSQTADVQYSLPDRVLLRLRRAGDDRTFFLRGDSLIGYDADSDEYLVRSKLRGTDTEDRLRRALGGLSEPINLILSPQAMRRWFAVFGKTGWSTSRSSGVIAITKGKTGAAVSLGFDARTNLLRSGQFVNGAAKMSWHIDYGPASRMIAFSVPSTAAKVDTFRVQAHPVVYKTSAAKQIVERMLRAGDRLRQGVVVASNNTGSVRMAFAYRAYHETGPDLEWAFDGRTLTARRGRNLYRGKSKKSMLLDYVAAMGGRIDPFLRNIVTGSVPFQEFLASGAVVSVGGQVSVKGLTCTIVNIQAGRSRSSLFVRPDGLVQSVGSDLLGARGETITTSSRRFLYAPANRTERYVLSPSARDTVRPLPNVPKPTFGARR